MQQDKTYKNSYSDVTTLFSDWVHSVYRYVIRTRGMYYMYMHNTIVYKKQRQGFLSLSIMYLVINCASKFSSHKKQRLIKYYFYLNFLFSFYLKCVSKHLVCISSAVKTSIKKTFYRIIWYIVNLSTR